MFFDVDGTLVDHDSAADTAVRTLRDTYPDVLGGLAETDLVALWREQQEHWFGEYAAGRVTFADQRAARVRALWASVGASRPSDADVDEVFGTYLTAYERAWALYDDVLPCLDGLEGPRLGVITNGDRAQQLSKLEACGLTSRFPVIVASSEVSAAKPSPEIFREAARRAGAEPSACTYVGDRLDTDAAAAASAGMTGVWLDRAGASTSVPGPVRRITTLSALAGWWTG